MKPVLFQLGPFPVSSFGVFLLLAFVVAILLMRARTARLGWNSGEVLDLSLYTIIGGVVGARIGHALVNLGDFARDPIRVVMIWRDPGFAFYGSLVGGAIVASLYGRRRGWSLGRIADTAAPGLALGYAVAMIGTLLYGLNYGRPTTLPWAVTLFGEARHPTQIYLLIAALIIFAILLGTERKSGAPGRLFWGFVLLYSIARIGIEVFMDSPRVVGPLTLAQAASILTAVLALIMSLVLGRRPVPVTPEAAGAGVSAGTAPGTGDPQPGVVEPRD